ncbi:MAG: hypothetical protein JRD89_16890 [Deltaproteobacteria bacterium]|nr:hypothetical protein [Deltaproteobacteria bacterium]
MKDNVPFCEIPNGEYTPVQWEKMLKKRQVELEAEGLPRCSCGAWVFRDGKWGNIHYYSGDTVQYCTDCDERLFVTKSGHPGRTAMVPMFPENEVEFGETHTEETYDTAGKLIRTFTGEFTVRRREVAEERDVLRQLNECLAKTNKRVVIARDMVSGELTGLDLCYLPTDEGAEQ